MFIAGKCPAGVPCRHDGKDAIVIDARFDGIARHGSDIKARRDEDRTARQPHGAKGASNTACRYR